MPRGINPPVEWVEPEVAKDHIASRRDIDPAAPIMVMDHSMPHAMTFPFATRSVRTPEVRLAGETVCFWLNGERPEYAKVPGTSEHDDWRSTPAGKQRILTILERLVRERDSLLSFHSESPFDPTLGGTDVDNVPDIPYLPLLMFRRDGNRLLHFLARYATYPVPVLDRRSGRFGIKQQAVHNGTALGEVLAAHSLITLLQTNTLHLIHRCERPTCERWFFKGNDGSKGCNNTDSQWIRDNAPQRPGARKSNYAYNKRRNERLNGIAKVE